MQVPLLELSSSFSSLSPSVTGKKMEHSFKSEWAGNIDVVAPQFSIKEEILSSDDETQTNSQKPEQAAASEYP